MVVVVRVNNNCYRVVPFMTMDGYVASCRYSVFKQMSESLFRQRCPVMTPFLTAMCTSFVEWVLALCVLVRGDVVAPETLTDLGPRY